LVLKIDGPNFELQKSNLPPSRRPIVGRSEIPSYVLYGEPYGSPFPDCLHCEILSERSRLHDWQIRPHRHYGLHQFFWIARGAVVVSSDSSQRDLTAPAAVMNAPLAVHGFDWEPGSEGYVVTVPTVNLERSLPGPTALLSRLDRSIILQCDDLETAPSGVSSIFAAIAAEYRSREEGRVEALLCQTGLLALWFLRSGSRQETNGHAETRPHVGLVRRFLALVEDGFRDHRPLSFYAGALGITTTHLSRACRRQFGLSAQAIIHDRLVLEAKRILAYTPASIAHIAQDLGFRDPAYFTKFFAHHVGETPTAFRRAFVD
jgi:AraC family transcriptional regulator, transcriptional activator of pobA